MADDDRHPRPPLSALADLRDPVQMDFFELLRQLEGPGMRFGRAGGAEREPARLGQDVRLSFAATDIANFTPGDSGRPPRVAVNVIGLFGPEGPMPLHLTRWVLARLSNRWFAGDREGATSDTSFLDFCNLLQHRLIALYWRAWADARPEMQVSRSETGGVAAVTRTQAGLGLPGGATGDQELDNARQRHATGLAREMRSPDRIARFLTTVVGAPVTIVEFVGSWIGIPEPLRSRLGESYARLGKSATLGPRSFDRQGRAEVRIGPLSADAFRALLGDPDRWARLRQALLFAAGHRTEFDVRLVLAPGEAPAARLGATQLGRTSWVDPPRNRLVDDLCLAGISGRPGSAPRMAA